MYTGFGIYIGQFFASNFSFSFIPTKTDDNIISIKPINPKVLEKDVKSVAEVLRAHGQRRTPLSMLSRGVGRS